jgi:hypothetical protein
MDADFVQAAGPVMPAGPLDHDPRRGDPAKAGLQLLETCPDSVAQGRLRLASLKIDLDGNLHSLSPHRAVTGLVPAGLELRQGSTRAAFVGSPASSSFLDTLESLAVANEELEDSPAACPGSMGS